MKICFHIFTTAVADNINLMGDLTIEVGAIVYQKFVDETEGHDFSY